MRIIVMGAGVIGVTTAYYLAQEGHEVVVVDKMSEVGQDATGGNAGLIAPGHSFAWASPQAPKMLLKSLRGEKTAIRVKLSANPRFLWWGMQFMRECTKKRARINTLAKLALCQYSQGEMDKLADAEAIDYQHEQGAVYVYRDQAELELGLAKMELLRSNGQHLEVLDAAGLGELDPAFAQSPIKVAGAIYGTTDATGNSEVFTKALVERCKKLGVEFRLGVEVKKLHADGKRITAAETSEGFLEGDRFVLALGIMSPFISRTVGQSLPIYPAKGYSLTVGVKNAESAPHVGGVDEKTLVAWSRQGDELRISSTAEFDGYDRGFDKDDFSNILGTARQLFPEAADWDTARMRSCMRPMTPDGPPIIGLGKKHSNLFYNTGHGHMGWTMACGSSRILVDMMSGRRPEVGVEAFKVRSIRR